MTKNKKRKTILRTIAENEGVGIARAGMLHDREREEQVLDPAQRFLLNREKGIGWTLKRDVGWNIKVHFDSDSFDSLVHTQEQTAQKRGIPHYVIDKGTQAQRFRFMNDIRKQLEGHFAVNVTVLEKKRIQTTLTSLSVIQHMRMADMAKAGVESFAELREKFIKEHASALIDFAPAYNYVFIYDWEELMADASDEWKDIVLSLLETGKKAGIHFIISTGSDDRYVKAWDEQGLVRFITIRSAYSGNPESAVTKIQDVWREIQIPTW
jgi:hypothetical protein